MTLVATAVTTTTFLVTSTHMEARRGNECYDYKNEKYDGN